MDGKLTNDEYYAVLWGIPQSFVGKPGILTSLNSSELFAYHWFTVGEAKTWKADYPGLVATYEKAISVDAGLGDAANNLAWFYSVVPILNLRDGTKAVSYAQKSTAVLADGDSVDTLACAFGTDGNFQEAVAAEQRAIAIGWAPQGSDLAGDLARLKTGQTCQDTSFGKDPRPFRQQRVLLGNTVSGKSANASH